MMKGFKISTLFIMMITVVPFVTSCSNDDEPAVTVYHQNYVQGKVNSTKIVMNDINANILDNISSYEFISNTQSNIPNKFDWEVKLIDTKDSIVTLYLHIDDVFRTNDIIYSPNESDVIKTKNTCYVIVTDVKNKTTKVYHPTHPSPMNAVWDMFMMSEDGKMQNLKDAACTCNHNNIHQWPGINGRLHGTLTSDDDTPDAMKIDINFRLY